MTDNTPEPFWRVRVGLAGVGMIHLAARGEPRVELDAVGELVALEAEWITDGLDADRLGYLDLTQVAAVSWRRARPRTPRPSEQERVARQWDAIAAYVRAHGGTSWDAVAEAVRGRNRDLRECRDDLLAAGVLVDRGRRQRLELWHRDDPQLRPAVRIHLPPRDAGPGRPGRSTT